MSRVHFVALFGLVAALALMPEAQANIVNNPGFDSGMTLIPNTTFDTGLDGWSLSGNSALDTTTFAGDPDHLNAIAAGLANYGGRILVSDSFPVTRTGPVQLSYDVHAQAGDFLWYFDYGGNPGVAISWYDADDNLLGRTAAGNMRWTHGGGWEHIDQFRSGSGTGGFDVIPAGTVRGEMYINQYAGNSTDHHVDNVWLRMTDWDPDYLRQITRHADALSGTHVLGLSSGGYGAYYNGAYSQMLPVQPGTTYSIDYNYKFVEEPDAKSRMVLRVWFYDADGNELSSDYSQVYTQGQGTDWQLFPTRVLTAPAGAAFARVHVANRSYNRYGPDNLFDNVVMNAAPTALFTATYNMDTLMFDLDASSSFDPDWRWDDGSDYIFRTDELTYRWLIDGTTWLDGMLTSVYLPKGDHTIQLFVSDAADNFGRGFTDSAQTGVYSDVPEPATMGLLVLAGGGLAGYLRRRRSA